jgi:hypothetical protein
MKPGNELDMLIAEKVFGAERHPDFNHLIRATPPILGGFITLNTVPKYSADIAMAWEVVEKLDLFATNFLQKNVAGKWGVWMESGDVIFGESAPHAICLAALTAINPK